MLEKQGLCSIRPVQDGSKFEWKEIPRKLFRLIYHKKISWPKDAFRSVWILKNRIQCVFCMEV